MAASFIGGPRFGRRRHTDCQWSKPGCRVLSGLLVASPRRARQTALPWRSFFCADEQLDRDLIPRRPPGPSTGAMVRFCAPCPVCGKAWTALRASRLLARSSPPSAEFRESTSYSRLRPCGCENSARPARSRCSRRWIKRGIVRRRLLPAQWIFGPIGRAGGNLPAKIHASRSAQGLGAPDLAHEIGGDNCRDCELSHRGRWETGKWCHPLRIGIQNIYSLRVSSPATAVER